MAELKNEQEGYIPGTCNIGKEELQRRKAAMVLYITITILCIVLMQVFHSRHIWRLFVFLPAAAAIVSSLQVYYHFCVNFGMRGVSNFGKLGHTTSDALEEYIRKDRAKALKMIIGSIVAGIAIAIIYFFLPI
jgi:predicted nucleic acid-binding Zn ribbon protein